MKRTISLLALLLLPAAAFAGEASEVLNTPKSLNLTHHIIGYLSIAVTVLAYVAAMSEDVIELRKSKPMVLGSAVVWFAICIYYALHGEAKVAAVAFESNL
ncbi:MAG: transporter, partial [Methylococcaceae bacterium NSM2-1]